MRGPINCYSYSLIPQRHRAIHRIVFGCIDNIARLGPLAALLARWHSFVGRKTYALDQFALHVHLLWCVKMK